MQKEQSLIQVQKTEMDMERQLVFQGELSLMLNDEDICHFASRDIHPDLFLMDHPLIEKQEEKIEQQYDLLTNICEELAVHTYIKDTPLIQLIDLAESKYFLSTQKKMHLAQRLRKMKLSEKRRYAKQRERGTHRAFLKYITKQIQNRLEQEPEGKKQKNRLSAQISRDRKKEYMNQLQNEKKMLLEKKKEMEKQNMRMKEILLKKEDLKPMHNSKNKENKGLVSVLILLGLILLMNILGSFKGVGKEDQVSLEKMMMSREQISFVEDRMSSLGIQVRLQDFIVSTSSVQIDSELAQSIESVKSLHFC